MKKFLSAVLAVMMLITCFATVAFAADDVSVSGNTVKANAGDTVTVDFTVTGEHAGYQIAVSAEGGLKITGAAGDVQFKPAVGNVVYFNMSNVTSSSFSLTVEIPAGTPYGEYDIKANVQEMVNASIEDLGTDVSYGKVILEAPKCDHNYEGKVTTEPGCETKGVMTYTCSKCGDSYTEEIPANGHKFGDWKVTTEPDCTNDGVETRACSVCGEKETRPVDATGHDHNNEWSTDGENHWHECDCGDKADLGKHVDKDNNDKCDVCGYDMSCKHDWGKGVYHAGENCGQEGYTEYTCSKCGETKKEYDGKFGPHIPENEWSKDKDNHWHECSICGEDLDKGAHVDRDKDNYCDVCQKNLGTGGGSSGDKDDVLKTGDITPYITFTAAALISMVAAAGYVLKRKFVK